MLSFLLLPRSLTALPEWFYYVSYGLIYRYAGAFLQENEFADNPRLEHADYLNVTEALPCPSNIPGSCIFVDGNHYLLQKYPSNGRIEDSELNYWINFGLCFVFVAGMWILNTVLHIVPLPAFIKAKFRNWFITFISKWFYILSINILYFYYVCVIFEINSQPQIKLYKAY